MKHSSRIRISVALAALWLAACGGGGDDTPVVATTPSATGSPSAPAPSPAPAPSSGMTLVSADTQMTPNASYGVNGTGTGTITLTLPPTAGLAVGDSVAVTGVGTTPWVVAQNAGQTIQTSTLGGNVAPGATWTQATTLGAQPWHWVAASRNGQVLVAGEGLQPAGASPAAIHVSSDGGQTWNAFSTGTNDTWISADLSATGDRIVAVEFGGGMYTSADRGATWTRVTSSPLVNDPLGLSFESVTVSQDGQRIAAVVQPSAPTTANPNVANVPEGRLVVSNDGGATWTAPTLPAGVHSWRSIDGSQDGAVLVAVAQGAEVFLSTDAGATWAPVTVALTSGGTSTPVFENWYRVRTSADGNTIAIAANTFGGAPGTGIYVSHDRGATWTRGFSLVADYTALAMSDDGMSIAATVSNTGTGTTSVTPGGRVVLSSDGGATFNPLTLPGTATNWRSIAMSGDASLLVAANGSFNTTPPTAGLLYTSVGNRTALGTGGSITGGPGQGVTLQYAGNGQFTVSSSVGGPFTIH